MDPLDRPDLDEVLAEFATGEPIVWIAALSLAPPGPVSSSEIDGFDWRLTILTETPLRLPTILANGTGDWIVVEPPLAALSVATGQTSPTKARDVGRPRLRALIGRLHLGIPLLIGGAVEWEGPAIQLADGRQRFGSSRGGTTLTLSDAAIDEIRRSTLGFRLATLRQHQQLALEWLTESWRIEEIPLRLATLWFAVVAIVDQAEEGQKKGTQLERVKKYLLGLPVSPARRDELFAKLDVAYGLRNRIVHEADRGCATQADVDQLFEATKELLWADLGRV